MPDPRIQDGEGREPDVNDARAPYRIWPEFMPFRRNGTPVVGNMGSGFREVIIMDKATFLRLVDENPALATARFEVPEYVDVE